MTLLFLACTATPDTQAAGDTSTAPSWGNFLIEATAAESVFRVSWTSREPATGRLAYGVDGAEDHALATVDSEDGLTHSALLAGLGADETWTVRAWSETADGEVEEGGGTIEVPAAPADIVPDYVTDDGPERGGFNLVTYATPGDGYVAIHDRAGRPTWWYHTSVEASILDAHYDPATSSVDMLLTDLVNDDVASRFLRVGLDGTVLAEVTDIAYHHAYAPLPTGGYLATAHDTRLVEGAYIQGDTLWELDADFQPVRAVWSAFDELDVPTHADEGSTLDWTHANVVTYDAETGKILLSLYELSTIIRLDYATLTTDWRFGGYGSDVQANPDETFVHQHGAHVFGEELLVFDNGEVPDSGVEDARSSVSTYAIDGSSATRTRWWQEEDGLYVPTLGNAEAGEDGLITVGWGTAGRLTELDPSAEGGFAKRYEMGSPLASPYGYVHRIATLEGATH